ncbi:hypothetical protein THAOC_12266 [Thalassiosira oceanica]|uniref:Uncharacterized protein n=1 Tax=Thalassiosira oceanica TaxID=159749 RepID=K0T8I1_THAOC|nr:hypothetical protein THAOC_12266 [Thalassiosira oceanica]|eukprot:EJK66772.1 hypothetical protein THAOC_12266 [Thalassiosira oceanica]
MARDDNPLDGFGLIGLIKETGVDDAGISPRKSFTSDSSDEETAFYKALGSRKLGLTSWNPIKIFRGLREVGRRLKEKGISGNFKGEGLVQGGVVIFDSAGNPRYAYREKTGEELPVEDIAAAVKALKSET